MNATRVPVGISTCLLGDPVRHDGGHKRDRFLTDVLGDYFAWVPVCPEFECGLGAPRESMRLVGTLEQPRLVTNETRVDLTAKLQEFNRKRLRRLEDDALCGFILKKDSPTCGMERVRVWHEGGGGYERKGVGLWAHALTNEMPLLPIEEEGRLNDPRLRENFIARVFCYARWRRMRDGAQRRDLVAFHTAHKLTLLSHSPERYRELGRIVGAIGTRPFDETLDLYGRLFMESLSIRATRANHSNALYHLMGYLKRELDADDRQELARSVEEYRKGLVPLAVALKLLQHHFRRHPDAWVSQQTYLDPYPIELMLRNAI